MCVVRVLKKKRSKTKNLDSVLGDSISKWFLFNSYCFLKKRKKLRTESFVFLCLFSKHAQHTSDIRWQNTIHRTLIFIYKIHRPVEGTLYQNGFGGGGGKARFNVATPTYATVTCTVG